MYYALPGNIAINNCFNARALHAAVTAKTGVIKIPSQLSDGLGSFGSLELRQREGGEFIGQPIDYSEANCVAVRKITLNSLQLSRVDLIKIDVEQVEALDGARQIIEKNCPIILVESIKSSRDHLRPWLEEHGQRVIEAAHLTSRSAGKRKAERAHDQGAACAIVGRLTGCEESLATEEPKHSA